MAAISKALLFLRVSLFAAAVPFIMRLKIERVATILERGREPHAVEPEVVERILAYVETAIAKGAPLVRGGCLTRGLARYYFLRRAGFDVSLHFGMGRVGKGKEFAGHCWLVKDDEPYFEKEDPRPLFIEMYHISREHGRRPVAAGTVGLGRLSHS